MLSTGICTKRISIFLVDAHEAVSGRSVTYFRLHSLDQHSQEMSGFPQLSPCLFFFYLSDHGSSVPTFPCADQAEQAQILMKL